MNAAKTLEEILEDSHRRSRDLVDKIREIYDAGQHLPVLTVGSMVYVVHPATRLPGKIQITTYNDSGALGDSIINSLDEVPSVLGNRGFKVLPADEAEMTLSRVSQAEARYQEMRVLSMSLGLS